MRKPVFVCSAVLCVLLLLLSGPCAAAAADALSLCMTRVLPALFPFFVASTLLCAALLAGSSKDSRNLRMKRYAPLLCWGLGAISGYPTGARVCSQMGRDDLSAACNLCSPAFIMSVAAAGFLGESRTALPILIAHYGASILALVLQRLYLGSNKTEVLTPSAPCVTLPGAIADGMTAMLRITGCVMFFSVCATLPESLFPIGGTLFSALLTGALEMTAGCREIAALVLPLRVKTAWISCIVSFGGCSVFLQARSVARIRSAGFYLLSKLFQGCCAFWIAFLTTDALCPEAEEAMFVSVEELTANLSALFSLLLSGSIGVVFSYLLALTLKRARRETVPG